MGAVGGMVVGAAGVLGVLGGASFAEGAVKTERIEYTVGETTYEGVLAYDDAVQGKRPGVLVCPEWWGMNEYSQMRARMLAEAGFVAFALDVYGKGKVTTDPKQAAEWSGVSQNAPLMHMVAGAGLRILAENPRVERTALAAIGYCMGGGIALELARSGVEHSQYLQVIGAFHASHIAADDPRSNARIKGTVLVCHGQDDPMVPAEQISEFHSQMKAAYVDYVFVSYAGAVHAFTNPGADKFGIKGVKYDEKADRRSWRELMGLLNEKFGRMMGRGGAGEGAPAAGAKDAPAAPASKGTDAKPEGADKR
jgi:dienelactone hydrolase